MEFSKRRNLCVLSVLALVLLLIFSGCDGGMKGDASESDVIQMDMNVKDDGVVSDIIANGDVIYVITETRSTGAPVTVTYSCSDCCGPARMIVVNGGACEPLGYRVSSAVIELNGEEVFGPSDFNQNVHIIDAYITLLPGENVLDITLRSRPGSKITIIIERLPCDD